MAGISSDGSVYFLDNTPDIFQITPGLLASSPGGLLGLKGNDKVSGSVEQNLIYGNQDSDILLGADKDDTLYGGKDNDLLVGKTGNDLLLGDKGNDFLLGDQGNDSLNGGNGGDTLIGNLGQDILTGGDDADVFVLQADPQVINSANADIITDFDSNIDLIPELLKLNRVHEKLASVISLRLAKCRVGTLVVSSTTSLTFLFAAKKQVVRPLKVTA